MFDNLSIRRKVTFVVLLASVMALGLATAGLVVYEVTTFKDRARANLVAIKDVLSVSLSEPEAWLDIRTVKETLNSLHSSTDIVCATYYRLDGTAFGQYNRNNIPAETTALPEKDGAYFSNGRLRLVETFNCQGQPVGRLDITSDLSTLNHGLNHSLVILAGVMVLLLGIGVVGANFLQKSIAKPLRELAQTALAVSEKNDYSLRAPIRGRDETGQVAQSFNAMLAAIEKHQDALRQSEARFRSVWQYSADGMRLSDSKGTILATNPAFCGMVGLSSEKLVGNPITITLASSQSNEAHIQEYQTQFEARAFPLRKEQVIKFRSGRTATVELSMSFVDLGRETVLLTLYRDITTRRLAEERVRLLSRAVEQSATMVIITDASGEIEYVNRKFLDVTGYHIEEVIGNTPRLLKSGHSTKRDYQAIWDTIKNGAQWSGELLNKRKDGTFFWIACIISPIKDSSGKITHYLADQEDITLRKEKEDYETKVALKMREAQKMESLGTLAGGIAHDFNNILSAIIGFTSLAKTDVVHQPELLSNLEEVLKASNRAKDLVRRILTFSRQSQQPERRPIHIHPVVLEVSKLLRSTLPATIEIESHLGAEDAIVVGDATQIHQVLMNLATNAAFAMKDKPGKLTINLKSMYLDKDAAKIHPDLSAGDYVHLSVSDTGCGMDAATMKRIYEPFFTTKGPGEGTGLGLSVVHGIVKDHNGVILVESTKGVGTTFQVYLPLQQSAEYHAEPPVQALPHGHGEYILVIDDEPALCKMIQMLLERLSYRVCAQTNAAEALRLIQENPKMFDAIITDFSMPILTGLDLATQVRKIRPDIPIVLTSGFFGKQTRDLAASIGITEIATKPVPPEVLAILVNRLFSQTHISDLHEENTRA